MRWLVVAVPVRFVLKAADVIRKLKPDVMERIDAIVDPLTD